MGGRQRGAAGGPHTALLDTPDAAAAPRPRQPLHRPHVPRPLLRLGVVAGTSVWRSGPASQSTIWSVWDVRLTDDTTFGSVGFLGCPPSARSDGGNSTLPSEAGSPLSSSPTCLKPVGNSINELQCVNMGHCMPVEAAGRRCAFIMPKVLVNIVFTCGREGYTCVECVWRVAIRGIGGTCPTECGTSVRLQSTRLMHNIHIRRCPAVRRHPPRSDGLEFRDNAPYNTPYDVPYNAQHLRTPADELYVSGRVN